MTRPAEHLSEEIVQEYLDDVLGLEARARVERHLAACARCAAEMDAWQTLFSGLGELPELGPAEGFTDRVMDAAPLRPSLGRRIAEHTRRVLGRGAGSLTDHLSPQGLQDLLDGALGAGDRRRAEAHLKACASCRNELGGWQGVFARLSELERVPAPEGFGDRVFTAWREARSEVLAPARAVSPRVSFVSGLVGLTERLLPSTPKGWAAGAVVAFIPMLPLLFIVGAVVSHPLLTFDGLVSLAVWLAADALQGLGALVAVELLGHPVALSLWKGVGALASTPALAATGLAAVWGASLLSAWILYRHLIAPSRARVPHA